MLGDSRAAGAALALCALLAGVVYAEQPSLRKAMESTLAQGGPAGPADGTQGAAASLLRARRSDAARWLALITEYARGESGSDASAGAPPPPALLQLPADSGGGVSATGSAGRRSVSLLVVPLPALPGHGHGQRGHGGHAECEKGDKEAHRHGSGKKYSVRRGGGGRHGGSGSRDEEHKPEPPHFRGEVHLSGEAPRGRPASSDRPRPRPRPSQRDRQGDQTRPLHSSRERTRGRPQDRPLDIPFVRALNRPVDRPRDRSDDQPSRPIDRALDRRPERPPKRPLDRPLDRSSNRPRGRPRDRPVASHPDRPRERTRPRFDDDQDFSPATNESVSSQRLVELFRAQLPTAPHLPPALLHDGPDVFDSPDSDARYTPDARNAAPNAFDVRFTGAGDAEQPRDYLPPAPEAAPRDQEPPQPRFERSMRLRATLTVRHSDYTEPYTAWWDAATGAARVDYHEAGTSTLRSMARDGRVRRAAVRTDRTGEREVVRCAVAAPLSATPEDRAPPALPDMSLFSFAGHSSAAGGARAEVWRHVVAGRAGELGAARGEALTFRHEMMLSRGRGGQPTPMRYTVVVDSSVLGADCEGYEHRYEEAREQEHDPELFNVDLDRVCEEREEMDAQEPAHMAQLEPLREFTMPARDPRHDAGLQNFVTQFERQYADGMEEAVRKALYVQHERFVSSCNRQDATFSVEVNFLGDRLDEELELLLGVRFEEDDGTAEEFPYSSAELRQLDDQLEKEFDWRPRGAVTHVRSQDSCSSCWAFAVVGSVEGALQIRTQRLVPLSEQALVDCAHSHGAHGCHGTWPSHAYNYVRDRGLPALDEYTPYMSKVLQCRADSVPPVTHCSGYVNVTPNKTDALKVAIRREAPTVVVVDARPKSFMFYKKGVLRDERCVKGPNQKLNHAVLAVGWGEQRGEPHFILKNTYSARWGDEGYIRLHAPSNTCGLLSVPSYALLRRRDVDRLPGGDGKGGGKGDGEGGKGDGEWEGEDEDDYDDAAR